MGTATETQSLDRQPIECRQAQFRSWVNTVRNPAERNSEGTRTIRTATGTAAADYDIAPLPDGHWAVTVHCTYRCGDCSGIGIPWTAFPSREACIDFFIDTARRHFRPSAQGFGSAAQGVAQAEMLRLLSGGLFGFIEPTPSVGGRGCDRSTTYLDRRSDDGEDETAAGA